MLFNSYVFIFVFLPCVALVHYAVAAKVGYRAVLGWLWAASLFYYAWWDPAYLPVILASTAFNLAISRALMAAAAPRWRKALLAAGIAGNLAALGYFKYASFLAANANALLGTSLDVGTIVLPLAISFFTFQQIAYLVDAYRGEVPPHGILDYGLFVTFFPQLIAGPIVHHREMMPQFADRSTRRLAWDDLAVGGSVFIVGLFKKVVLADNLALYASPVFAAADGGARLAFAEAWTGALAYTFQLYFDFSGYSDMAIGAALVFGIRLPANFLSPYKATSIIEFWRRWHITLSRFLRDYLYIPLGGNRHGTGRRLLNLEITMLLGGLWHGAGWNFVIWGGLHGLYLGINHLLLWAFRPTRPAGALRLGLGWLATFAAVIVGWVFFRATTLDGAVRMLAAMSGWHGLAAPARLPGSAVDAEADVAAPTGLMPGTDLSADPAGLLLLAASFAICLGLPNTWEWGVAAAERLRRAGPGLGIRDLLGLRLRPSPAYAAILAAMFALATLSLSGESEFLYFQF